MPVSAADFHVVGATSDDINALNSALAYLQQSPTAAYQLSVAADNGVEIDIVGSGYQDGEGTDAKGELQDGVTRVFWDPYSGLELSNGKEQSPALGLGHEFGHAVDPNGEDMTPDSQYATLAERTAIEQSEDPEANDLGEPTRDDHGGIPEPAPTTYHTDVNPGELPVDGGGANTPGWSGGMGGYGDYGDGSDGDGGGGDSGGGDSGGGGSGGGGGDSGGGGSGGGGGDGGDPLPPDPGKGEQDDGVKGQPTSQAAAAHTAASSSASADSAQAPEANHNSAASPDLQNTSNQHQVVLDQLAGSSSSYQQDQGAYQEHTFMHSDVLHNSMRLSDDNESSS